jgi:hypothetical protein
VTTGARGNRDSSPRPHIARLRFTAVRVLTFCLASLPSWSALAGLPTRDVSARAREIGTDKPQDVPARLVVTTPDRVRLKFPAFVLGIEKASRKIIGCPPDRGLEVARPPRAVRDQTHRTLHETPLASDCLFVSHLAEFVPTSEPGKFAPVLRYDTYREADPPAAREVFISGRRATLALSGRLTEIARQRAAAGRPISHLIVFATGWHTPQVRTLADMDELFESIKAAGAEDHTFSPLFFGISWPSFSDEFAESLTRGASTVAKLAPAALEHPVHTKTIERLLADSGRSDRLGFLGYPAISKDADEVGMVAVSTLVNQVLIPVRETQPAKPRVIVIGHSFGARIASWTPFTAALLPRMAGATVSTGPDLVIKLQGAFPAARFDTTIKHRRPYVEGASFADHSAFRTLFAYTCSNDEALRHARIFDVMIGDVQAFERAMANESPAFSTRKIIDNDFAKLELDPASRKVLLIDASEIITKHNDVRNEKVGRLVWELMTKLAPR